MKLKNILKITGALHILLGLLIISLLIFSVETIAGDASSKTLLLVRGTADVVAAYKANPKSVKMAGGSVRGSMDHLIGALAFQEAGADPNKVVYIPYDAGGKALAGLLSGETQILSTGLGEVMGARDQVRIIGITAPKRVSDAPDVPTLKEQGFDVQFVNWRGFFGPPGMSSSDKREIAKMLGDVQKTPEWEAVRKRNAWVNIYNPDKKFVKFLQTQNTLKLHRHFNNFILFLKLHINTIHMKSLQNIIF